jgi:hypothetical protein
MAEHAQTESTLLPAPVLLAFLEISVRLLSTIVHQLLARMEVPVSTKRMASPVRVFLVSVETFARPTMMTAHRIHV